MTNNKFTLQEEFIPRVKTSLFEGYTLEEEFRLTEDGIDIGYDEGSAPATDTTTAKTAETASTDNTETNIAADSSEVTTLVKKINDTLTKINDKFEKSNHEGGDTSNLKHIRDLINNINTAIASNRDQNYTGLGNKIAGFLRELSVELTKMDNAIASDSIHKTNFLTDSKLIKEIMSTITAGKTDKNTISKISGIMTDFTAILRSLADEATKENAGSTASVQQAIKLLKAAKAILENSPTEELIAKINTAVNKLYDEVDKLHEAVDFNALSRACDEFVQATATTIKNNYTQLQTEKEVELDNTTDNIDWDKEYKTAVDKNEFWQRYYKGAWGKYAQQIYALGKPFREECTKLGFTESSNPFIKYLKGWAINNIFAKGNNFPTDTYTAIHDAVASGYLDRNELKKVNADLYLIYNTSFITNARSIGESLQLLQWNSNIAKRGDGYGDKIRQVADNKQTLDAITPKYKELAQTMAAAIKKNQLAPAKTLIRYVFFVDENKENLRAYSDIKDIVNELLDLSDSQVFVVTKHTITEWYPKLVGEYGWARIVAWFYATLLQQINDPNALAQHFPAGYSISNAEKDLGLKLSIEIGRKIHKDLAKKADMTSQDLIELFDGFVEEHEKEAAK